MAEVETVQRGIATQFPIVVGTCPACGSRSLFLGAGGYVTCSILRCPEPDAASKRLNPETDR